MEQIYRRITDRRILEKLLGCDLRGLGLFRIMLGLIVLGDLYCRSLSIKAHYTDAGIFQSDEVLKILSRWNICFHCWSGDSDFIASLFTIHAGLALLLVLGVGGRPVTILNWLFLVSLQQRSPLILFGGDTLLRMSLFWAMFLPLYERFSIHSRNALSRTGVQPHLSVATVAIHAQLLIMYWFTYSGKNGVTWETGAAVKLALLYDNFATPLAISVRDRISLELSVILTKVVLLAESVGPLFWFVPLFHDRFRTASIFSFVLMHLLFSSFIVLNIFPFVHIAAFLPLLPGKFWDALLGHESQNLELSKAEPSISPFDVFTAVVLGYVLSWNLARWPGRSVRLLPSECDVLADAIWLRQSWVFFEPDPPIDSGWYVVPGLTAAGKQVDVLNPPQTDVHWTAPSCISCLFPDGRWIKTFSNLWLKQNSKFRPGLAAYLCRRWNDRRDDLDNLSSIALYYVFSQPELAMLATEAKERAVLLLQYECEARS